MPSPSTSQRKVSTARLSSSRLTAVQNCSSSIISATPSRPYETQEPLLKDLNQCVEYQKTVEFFIKTKGPHSYFERNGGSLEKAVANANRSMDEKQKSSRDYTYSELGRLIEKLGSI